MNDRTKRESAAVRATKAVVVAAPHDTLGDIEERLHRETDSFKMLQYVYVLDERQKLVGVLSVRDVFSRSPDTRAYEVMKADYVSVRPRTDQEVAAVQALKHGIRAMPVTTKDGTFVGVVTSDSILEILSEEHSEDLLYFGGVQASYSAGALLKQRLVVLLSARLPWLLIGLGGGFVAAFVVERFETVLDSYIVLAFFLPLVVYMSDAVANQTLTIFIRALALDHNFSVLRYVLREVLLGFCIAALVGSVLTALSFLWFGDIGVALVLGSALFCAVLVAVVTALLIALLLVWMRKDPAIGSGPFATIIIDIMTIVIYFTIATLFLPLGS